MPRVTPVASKADVAPEHQAVVDDVLKVFGAVRGPFSMMLHSPEMTKRMLPLVPFFRDESVVEGKLRSVGILAAVREPVARPGARLSTYAVAGRRSRRSRASPSSGHPSVGARTLPRGRDQREVRRGHPPRQTAGGTVRSGAASGTPPPTSVSSGPALCWEIHASMRAHQE